MPLSDAQREILQAMADGHKMVFSQDGDMAWLSPKHRSGFLADQAVISLRRRGYIGAAPFDEDEHGRFGPPTVITDAGRRALEQGE